MIGFNPNSKSKVHPGGDEGQFLFIIRPKYLIKGALDYPG